MEFLKIASNGQWSLHKADKPFKAVNKPTMEGALHEDHGQKGKLHNFNSGQVQSANTNPRKDAKPSRLLDSEYNERHPGVGN